MTSVGDCEKFNAPMKGFYRKGYQAAFRCAGRQAQRRAEDGSVWKQIRAGSPHYYNPSLCQHWRQACRQQNCRLSFCSHRPFYISNSSFSANAVVTAELNPEGDSAIVTIDRFSRGDLFNLILNLCSDNEIIDSYSLPRIEARCRDSALVIIAVNAPAESALVPAFHPNDGITSYAITPIAPGTESISINAARRSPYSAITLNGSSINGNIANQAITLTPGANLITIQVMADSGETREYAISAYGQAAAH